MGQTQPMQDVSTGWCEICTDHKPTAWPPFSLVLQFDADGSGPNHIVVEDTGTAEDNVPLQNSPSYSFPCP